ncbi:MAG TPA: ParA family protein [Actinomycetota bacterium]|nr:ParA family protein [Actinomycetota bacterium]
MPRVLAFANQKGGVAKTTTTLSIGAALSERGRSVLAVDMDPQGALTYSTGVDPDTLDETVNDVLIRRLPVQKVVLSGEVDLIPANIDLAGAEAVLLAKTGREYALQRALREVLPIYDYILIDCPPSLGILTINALTAAHAVVIPLQSEALSHRGVGQLIETLQDIRHFTNPDLEVVGVIPTMYDGRSRHAREVLEDVGNRYDVRVLRPAVRRSIRFAEATQAGRSILSFAPNHPGAAAYRELAAVIDGEEVPLEAEANAQEDA